MKKIADGLFRLLSACTKPSEERQSGLLCSELRYTRHFILRCYRESRFSYFHPGLIEYANEVILIAGNDLASHACHGEQMDTAARAQQVCFDLHG